ncbi:MAG: MFS transporter, partial [Pseudomonas sp.]
MNKALDLSHPLGEVGTGHARRVPMIIGCALFMELIDATAVLTALPQMAQDFGEPSVRMNLVVSLYL